MLGANPAVASRAKPIAEARRVVPEVVFFIVITYVVKNLPTSGTSHY